MADTDTIKLNSVLVIDDCDGDVFLARKAFKKAGVCENVVSMSDGFKGLTFLRNFDSGKADLGDGFPPALILLDINMPRMNGFAFLEQFEQLRTEDCYHSMVVMMFSSSENQEDVTRALSYDCVKGFLMKPLTARSLREKMSVFMDIALNAHRKRGK